MVEVRVVVSADGERTGSVMGVVYVMMETDDDEDDEDEEEPVGVSEAGGVVGV